MACVLAMGSVPRLVEAKTLTLANWRRSESEKSASKALSVSR